MKTGAVKPRVLLLGSALEGGGAERRFHNLARYLFRGGAAIRTLCDSSPAHTEGLSDFRSFAWRSEWSYPRIIVQLRRELARRRFHAVLSFGRFPNLVAWLATRALKGPPRLILSEITRPWQELSTLPKGMKSCVERHLVKRAYPCADLFLANSDDGVLEAIRYLGVDEDRTARVPNILDRASILVRAYREPPVSWPTNRYVILMAGRLEALKRPDTLIEALARLPSDLDCAVVLAGDGEEESSLRRLAGTLGVSERVHFFGWVNNPYPLFRRAHLYVLCSEYEGFSNSMVEAMLLDTPVVASLCNSDLRRLFEAGAVAVFETGRADQLARAIGQLLQDPAKRVQMAERAAEEVRRYDLKPAIEAYEKLIFRNSQRAQ